MQTQGPGTSESPSGGTEQSSTSAAAQTTKDPDLEENPVQPDFALASLPTTLRLPVRKLSFRLTHRFSESIDDHTRKGTITIQ